MLWSSIYDKKKDEPKSIIDNDKIEEKQEKYPLIIFKNEEIHILKIRLNDFTSTCFVNWEKNRPPDNIRIEDISNHYKHNNIEIVPGIISLWCPQKWTIDKMMMDQEFLLQNSFTIYDGIHRFYAGFRYLESFSKKQETPNIYAIVCIYFTIKEQDIIQDFININKSIPIPTYYLSGNRSILKICEKVADYFCQHYLSFQSASRNPNVYNFNRDGLIECLSNTRFHAWDEKKIIDILLEINKMAKTILRYKKKPKKCEVFQFYLFGLEWNQIRQMIETSSCAS